MNDALSNTSVVYDEEPFPKDRAAICPTCGHRRDEHNPFMVKPEKMEKYGFERTSCAYQPDCKCPGFPL